MFTFLIYEPFSIMPLIDYVACASLTTVTATLVGVKRLLGSISDLLFTLVDVYVHYIIPTM